MALFKFGHFKLKIFQKLFKLGAWNLLSWLGMMSRITIEQMSSIVSV